MYCIVVYCSNGFVDLGIVGFECVFYKKEVAEHALTNEGFHKSLTDDSWCKNDTEIQYTAYIESLPDRSSSCF